MQVVRVVLAASIAGCGFSVGGGGNATGDDVPAIDAPSGDGPDGPVDSGGPISGKQRVKLTFQNGTRNLALDNFVALVVLDPQRVNYAAITANGANLRFTDADGTALDHQIDEWNPGGTSQVWVRVPLIDAASDADYVVMHYGDPALSDAQDPAGVWAGHTAVWHLAQDPGPGTAGDIRDSAGVNHGTASTGMQTGDLVPGIVGRGLRFVGTGTGVTANAITVTRYTWSMWVRGTTAPVVASSNKEPINNGDVTFNFSWDHSMAAYVGAAAQKDAGAWHSVAPPALLANTWYFLAGTYDGANLCIYRNGDAGNCVASGAPLPPNGAFLLGSAASGSATFSGLIDEVRVSATALSALRVQAEHVNQRAAIANPFVVFSAPESDP
ncbi:MAG: DUF2341 domain-containing protein [Polyangiales bacterium]